MSAINQYLDLYRQHAAVICRHAPAALNARREAAFRVLEALPRLPKVGDEGFEAVSLEDMFAPDYGINITRRQFDANPAELQGCDLPNAGTFAAMVVNDAFVADDKLAGRLPAGVEVMSLIGAAAKYPDAVARSVAPEANPVAALNSLLLQDGVYIRVARNVVVDKPIQILSTFNTSEPLLAARRIVVDMEPDAQATVLLCDHPRSRQADYLSCRVVEVRLAENAKLDFYDLEESTDRSRRASVFAAEQQAYSVLNTVGITLSTASTRNEFHVSHRGPGAETHLGGMVIAGGSEVVDNATFVEHSTPRCTSRQLFKYAMFDQSHGAFEGLVTVLPQAVFTDAQQTNRNLLASPTAKMNAMPQLIIDCDEVKASHGATTGQLDEAALFYMQQRGIPQAEARMMLINAFMDEVLQRINHEPVRERLRHLVDRRLRGCSAVCSNCSIDSLRKQ